MKIERSGSTLAQGAYNVEKTVIEMFVNSNTNVTRYKPNNSAYGTTDFIIQSGGTKFICEMKVRRETSTKYSTWIIEKKKFDQLKEIQKKYNLKPLYFNYYTDEVMRIWDLSEVEETDFTWFPKLLPKETTVNEGEVVMVEKMVTSLKPNKANQTIQFID